MVSEKGAKSVEMMDERGGDEDFAAMLEESFEKDGKERLTTGTIVEINEESVLIDVGEKIEGRVSISEFMGADGQLSIKVGDKLPVYVTGHRNERPVVSYQKAAKKEKNIKYIESIADDFADKVIEAEIVKQNKGGFILTNEDAEFFMPRVAAFIKDEKKAIGKVVKACIIDVKKDTANIVVSRKRFFDLDWQGKKEKIDKLLAVKDAIYKGKVQKITSFGMFVEVEGVEGLVHYTEISYKGPVNPAKHFNEGDETEVKVLGYDEDKKRLSLSVKAVMDDPWREIKNELEVGDTIKVAVSNIEPYGAFVDLGNDIEGFLHISEISWDKNIKHPNEYLQEGQEIDVEVIEIDTEKRKLRVSLKKLHAKPFESFLKLHKEGDTIKGVVTTTTDFGAFVKMNSIEGLLHNEDAFWTKNEKCKDIYKEGDAIEVKIAKIDREKERISLTRKGIIENPTQSYAKTHKIDDVVKGKIRDIKDFGVFINLSENVDALIRNEDLLPLKKEELKIGDEVEGALSLIDAENNKIRVSIRKIDRLKERENLKELNLKNDDKMTLGDVIRDKISEK